MPMQEAPAGRHGFAKADPSDVKTIETIIPALLDAFSFEPNKAPQWSRLRSLFHPNAMLVPARAAVDRPPVILSVETYISHSMNQLSRSNIRKRGMKQHEIARHVHNYVNFADVFSVVEVRYQDDDTLISRGINSLQLLKSQDRWMILSILWDDEHEDLPIPDDLFGD